MIGGLSNDEGAIVADAPSVSANLENADIPLANQFISLNQWNY